MATHLSSKNKLAGLSLAATGIVYGDIGTSPIYALNTIFSSAQHPITLVEEHILGVLSLVFWSLMIVVSVKGTSKNPFHGLFRGRSFRLDTPMYPALRKTQGRSLIASRNDGGKS